jgi:N-acetylglucosaminyldiphosphoundecaprenol N-acetyl-beta-D-mannosaminyltransferase
MYEQKQIISTNINLGSLDFFINTVFNNLIPKGSSYICFANVHSLVLAYKNNDFNTVLNSADWVAPDGRALTIYLKLFESTNQERIAGMDVFPQLIKKANEFEASVYFYGSTNESLNRIKKKILKDYPKVKIAGMYSPPFRRITDEEQNVINQKINDANPDLVFVSLGCPKQEFWMKSQKGKVNACMLGVGQAFKTFSGEEKRLHPILRNFKWLPLEWIYRLYLEPKRLWKRFFWSNTLFLWLVLKKGLLKLIGK